MHDLLAIAKFLGLYMINVTRRAVRYCCWFDWQVTGVVGRAELLSSVFYLWALMVYARSIGKDRHIGMLFAALIIFCLSNSCVCACFMAVSPGASLVKEQFWRNALDRSHYLQECSRSFSNSFAAYKIKRLRTSVCFGSNFEWYFWWQWHNFYLYTVNERMLTTQQWGTL